MIDQETVTKVRDEYPWASWAVWDEAFPDGDCVEEHPVELVDFIIEKRANLTPEVILMGLNRSDDLPGPFTNFHAPTRKHFDYRLKEFIQDGELDRLQAAYMTDLVDEVDPDAASVTVTDEDAEVLLEQLRLLDQPAYHVVCFGNKPFNGLIDYFDLDPTDRGNEIKYASTTVDGMQLHIYRFWFYGLYGALQHKVDIFQAQLRHLNNSLAQR